MEKLKNKVAFISGGTSGIGLATARELIQQGARVIITGRYTQTVDETVKLLGANAYGIVCDHANMNDIAKLNKQVTKISDKIDIVFANAGYGKFAPVELVTEAMFDELFNVLAKGTFFTVQALLPLINEGGSIIFNTSIVSGYGSSNASVYSGAKAAVQSFVKTFAAELTAKKIRVNGISPGYTETDGFNKTGLAPDEIANTKKQITSILPFQRFAHAEEVAKGVSFLASDDSSYIHATEIVVDGGYLNLR